MPVYLYEVINKDGSAGQRFEVQQAMSDPPLAEHPETGEPVRRVYMPPHIGVGRWSDRAMTRNMADDKKLDRLGFTKYVKASDGHYEKAVGQGPDILKK